MLQQESKIERRVARLRDIMLIAQDSLLLVKVNGSVGGRIGITLALVQHKGRGKLAGQGFCLDKRFIHDGNSCRRGTPRLTRRRARPDSALQRIEAGHLDLRNDNRQGFVDRNEVAEDLGHANRQRLVGRDRLTAHLRDSNGRLRVNDSAYAKLSYPASHSITR